MFTLVCLAAPISSLLELQSKSWVIELELELSAPRELTQSSGSDSAFRKGLPEFGQNNETNRLKTLLEWVKRSVAEQNDSDCMHTSYVFIRKLLYNL